MSEETTTTATEPTQTTTEPAAEPTAPAIEPAKTEPTAGTEPTKGKEETTPELTVDSYKDISFDNCEGLYDPSGLSKEFKELALANKLPPEIAKSFADLHHRQVKDLGEGYLKMQEQWAKESEEKFGKENLKNIETNCGRVLEMFDKEGKFRELMQFAGVTKHPATLSFFKALGEQVLEKQTVNPSATNSPSIKELEDFYTND